MTKGSTNRSQKIKGIVNQKERKEIVNEVKAEISKAEYRDI